jgi:hypothetical protein
MICPDVVHRANAAHINDRASTNAKEAAWFPRSARGQIGAVKNSWIHICAMELWRLSRFV